MNVNLNANQERKTLFGGNLFRNGNEMSVQDRIAQKRQLYVKQGNKMVKDADTAERKVDKSIEDARNLVRESIDALGKYTKEIEGIDGRIAQAKELFEVEDGSQEQKDLELLLKKQRSTSGIGEKMTEEEWERAKEIEGKETGYQKMALELYAQRDHYTREREKAQLKVSAINDVIRRIKIDRPASQGMLDAQKSKEDLMDTASKEALGMLMEDARDTIDEKAEELEEAAEKREEAKEELEERLEASKEDREQAEEAVDSAQKAAEEMAKQIIDASDMESAIDEEVRKKLEALLKKLEEVKGISIDQTV